MCCLVLCFSLAFFLQLEKERQRATRTEDSPVNSGYGILDSLTGGSKDKPQGRGTLTDILVNNYLYVSVSRTY